MHAIDTKRERSMLDRLRRKGREILRALGEELGGPLVELALAMPMLTVLLLGAVEFGRVAYAYMQVNNAAHAGAAYGAQSHITASNTTYIAQAATDDAANVSGLTATSSIVCSCSSGTSITCANAATTCTSPSHIIESVEVNTSVTYNPLFHLPGLPTTYTLQGQAIMRVEQ